MVPGKPFFYFQFKVLFSEINTTGSVVRPIREAQTPTSSQPSNKGGIVGQSNPSAHQRLIQQRIRQRLHQQRSHHISPQTHHRRLHHGHARQHHITPHHHPHLVGSVKERFGGGEKETNPLKRLRERQKQKGEVKQQEQEGGKAREAETKGQEKQQGGNVQIITQAPNLVDGK